MIPRYRNDTAGPIRDNDLKTAFGAGSPVLARIYRYDAGRGRARSKKCRRKKRKGKTQNGKCFHPPAPE